MSSTVTKHKLQKLMDEIEELKQTNRDHEDKIRHLNKTNRDHEDKIQHLNNKYCDLDSINNCLTTENEEYKAKIQHLEQLENLELPSDKTNLTTKIKEYEDEIQSLKQKNLELASDKTNLTTKIKKYEDEIQSLQQELCTANDNSKIYSHISLSPISVDKVQRCTEWWCPEHSNFNTIVKTIEVNNEEDRLKIKQAKGRIKYWLRKDDGVMCCILNRINKSRNKFLPPSNWPK